MRRVVFTAMLTVALCGLGSAQMSRNADELVPNGKGWGERATPSGLANGKARPVRGNGISYHGGPVMLNTVPVYYIWYGNWGTDSALNLLQTFIGDLSGSGYERINTTYYDGSNNHVSGLLSFGGSTFVTGGSTSLGDADIKNIVAAHCGDFGGCKTNALYFVLTSQEVNETSGFCTQYCGWHTHGTINGLDIKYSFVGNPARCLSSCAAQSTSPNGNAGADGMASIVAHESEEAISDPDLNAWYDTRGAENADKCAWTFGTTSTASNGSKYNFTGKSNTRYLIQQNWVNASGGYCAMSY